MADKIRQWPENITSGEIRYGRANNYDGFYLADAMHGIPTIGSVSPTDPVTIRGQNVRVFNYPAQTEAVAKALCDRWNAYPETMAALVALEAEIQRLKALSMEVASSVNAAAVDAARAAIVKHGASS